MGGIFPSGLLLAAGIIKNVSSLSGNLLNDLCYYVNKTLSVKPLSSTWITSVFITTVFFFYKNIFYKNIEAEICEILRIF